MDLITIQNRIKEIESKKGDDEVAHALEDELLEEFVTAIKEGKYINRSTIMMCASEVLKVKDIDFARWTA